MQKQFNHFITRNNLLVNIQSGFRSHHSCITALTKIIEDIRADLDIDKATFLVLLDFTKAFDLVDHTVLLNKLRQRFHISPDATKLLSSFLSDRKQAVFLNEEFSDFLPVPQGVPQGSILSPLLFSMYINEIGLIINQASKHFYADDIQIYKSCPLGLIDDCVFTLNKELEKVSNWASCNGLILNPIKCKCIVISRKELDLSYFPSIKLDNNALEFVNTCKNLGVIFNRTLTWNDHINSLVGKTYGTLRALWTAQEFTPLQTRAMLARTLVIPVLTYGCEIFYNCDAISKNKLKVAFNSTIRYIFGLRRYDHVSHLQKSLLNMSFDAFMRFRTLILYFKILKTRQPTYLHGKLRLSVSNRSTSVILPRFSCLTSERQFFIAACRLWNSLPTHLRDIDDLHIFQNKLKIFFSNQSN